MKPLILTSTQQTTPETPGPRQDYLMLTEMLGGTLSYPPKSDDTLLSRIEKKTAADLRQAFAALRQRRQVSVYFSLSEKIGVPLALLLPRNRRQRPAHVLIAHHVTSPNKRKLQNRTGYLHRFDRLITLGETQRRYCLDEAHVAPERIAAVRHSVDGKFWTPNIPTTPSEKPYLLAVGRERRDYETFAGALRLLPDLPAVVVASSPWSRQAGQATTSGDAPKNMDFRRGFTYVQLRDLYLGASLVIVPLEAGTTYAAGSTGCLEGMAMRKPVLASATPGLVDYQRGDDGTEMVATVPAADPEALAAGIRALLADPERAQRLAVSGRHFVESVANTDTYVNAVARVVREAETNT